MEEDFCDMTLACEDKCIKTHKLIIFSQSPVLRDIQKSTHNQHPFIYLRKVKYKDLQNLLTFIYQGEVNVAEEDLANFLEVAEELNIRGLAEGNMGGRDSRELDPSEFTFHEGVKCSCHKCEYKATTKSDLNRHIKLIHEGVQHPCDQCDYKATQTRLLCDHQLKYHN